MIFNIMAAGPTAYIPSLDKFLQEDSKWIGVDRGALYLMKRNIPILASFGDFDSVNDTEREQINSYSD